MAVTENDVWVLANLKETQLERVRVGQRVKLAVDTFPKHPFTGRVDSIEAGSGATYALLPPDNATGNFTKIVQRVPVKLTFDRDSIKGYEDLVVAGLSVTPSIDISTPRATAALARSSRPVALVSFPCRRIAPARR